MARPGDISDTSINSARSLNCWGFSDVNSGTDASCSGVGCCGREPDALMPSVLRGPLGCDSPMSLDSHPEAWPRSYAPTDPSTMPDDQRLTARASKKSAPETSD